jgi:outer membrane receptor protein involved in Fe transport
VVFLGVLRQDADPFALKRSNMRIQSFFFLFLLLVTAELGFAQGKIAGRVTDAATGEALIGVNVVIDGTTQGTTTDVDGNYIILNVRPGEYTLRFSYIGFSTQLVSEIRVSTGQTTRYDLELREEVIEGEEIVIQAERPLVQKDLTSSKKTVVAEEIDALPVEGFFGVLVTQAGVNQGPDGAIHIRGGRSNEVSYLVDGMSVGNPFDTNGLATSVAADAIQEMTVISGAFNAEYGKAMSGIVNLVTKEGDERYRGSVSFYGGDNVTKHSDIFGAPTSTSNLGLNVFTGEGTLSGPLPFYKKMRFFVSGRYDKNEGTIFGRDLFLPSDSANFNGSPRLLETIREYIPDYDGPAWYYEMHGKPWYEYGERDPLPGKDRALNPRESGNLIVKFSIRPSRSGKLEYSILMDGSKRKLYDFGYKYNPNGTATYRDRSFNHSLHWTQTLTDRAFYTVRASYANNEAKTFLYEDPYNPLYVSSGNIIGFPGNQFLFGGDQKGNTREASRSVRIKFDMTQQLGIIHETKFGFEVQRHSLDRRNFVILYDGDNYRTPTVPPVDTPAHDVYTDQRVFEFSTYAQDKLEFDDFIINAGLRFEYFQPNGDFFPDILNPPVQPGEFNDVRQPAEATVLLMPRLGVSFPITETGIIHFSYGHFAQMPSLRNLYLNPEFEFSLSSAPTFGNTNMRPERTVQYEIGMQQGLTDELAFTVTGFYKDIRDYLALQTIRFSTISGEDVYNIYLNRDYANVKGVTFALTKRRGRNGMLSATLDYTFQIAEGNNNQTNAFFFNSLSGRENELELIPLSFDQRHVISSTVTLTKPGRWGASLITSTSTGYPYTPQLFDQKIDQLPNQERKPNLFKMDAHLYYDVPVAGDASVRVFAKVFNVFDILNENSVFSDTGRATYSLSGQRGVHASWEPAYGLPGIADLDEYNTRPHYFSSPREVRLGATVNF